MLRLQGQGLACERPIQLPQLRRARAVDGPVFLNAFRENMTDEELVTITKALHASATDLRSVGPDEPGSSETQRAAIEQLGIAVELLADIVYRMGKR
jgi:hypothetical protein